MRYSHFVAFGCAVAAFIFGGLAAGQGQPAPPGRGPQAQPSQQPPPPPILSVQNLRTKANDPETLSNNRIFGNASQPGFYISRYRSAPMATTRPHYHDQDRWILVIKGTWYAGEGKVYRPETMIPAKPGDIMYHPAGYIHFDGSRDNEEVLVDIFGIGPVKTVQVEEDEKGNPVTPAPR
jgi:quercetin dioxygenase-like cupin family protein